MRSDRTRVPPVTPERSPPASRMTGADSPVMADSSTEATPATISPSPGMIWPASTTTRSPFNEGRGNRRFDQSAMFALEGGLGVVAVAQPKGGRFLPRLAQGVGLGLAARLGQRLGEVGEQHRQEQPDVQSDQVASRSAWLGQVEELGDRVEDRQDGADLDHEHHGVLPLDVGPEHDERLLQRRLQQVRREQALVAGWRGGRVSFRRSKGRSVIVDIADFLSLIIEPFPNMPLRSELVKRDRRRASLHAPAIGPPLNRACQFPNGIGPKCSATGPSTAAGMNSSAPTSKIVPSSTKPNVSVSVRSVPAVNGVGFLAARLPASANGAMIGMNRPNSMTRPVAISQYGLDGRRLTGRCYLLLVETPGVAQPLEAGAVVGGGGTELVEDLRKAVRAGLFVASVPQSMAANRPVGTKIRMG